MNKADHLIEARDCKYISKDLYLSIREDCYTSLKILNGYIRYLDDRNKEASENQ